jgi:hypothetical protein
MPLLADSASDSREKLLRSHSVERGEPVPQRTAGHAGGMVVLRQDWKSEIVSFQPVNIVIVINARKIVALIRTTIWHFIIAVIIFLLILTLVDACELTKRIVFAQTSSICVSTSSLISMSR